MAAGLKTIIALSFVSLPALRPALLTFFPDPRHWLPPRHSLLRSLAQLLAINCRRDLRCRPVAQLDMFAMCQPR